MKQRTLFDKPKVKDNTPLPGWVRVENTDYFINAFNKLLSLQEDILFDHSSISPFAYFNAGQLELYINTDWEVTGDIIPIVKKYKTVPRYMLYCPRGSMSRIDEVFKELSKTSCKPVKMVAITEKYQELFLKHFPDYKSVKVEGDYIYDIDEIMKAEGADWRPIRRRVNKAKRTIPNLEFKHLSSETYLDAKGIFTEWKDTQGEKYFRVTIGRDLRLIDEYYDKNDDDVTCLIAYSNGKPISVFFNMRCKFNPQFSVGVTGKSLYEYGEIGYLTEWKVREIMKQKGIKYENIGGVYSKGVKENKERWRPINVFNAYEIMLK